MGSQLEAAFRLSIGVYHLPRPRQDPAAVLARLLAAETGLTLVKQLPESAPARPQVALLTPPIKEAPPPDDESLKYFGRGLSAGIGGRWRRQARCRCCCSPGRGTRPRR